MTKIYKCKCGMILNVRQLVKNSVKVCKKCGELLPQKEIMRIYRGDGLQEFRMDCLCGEKYVIVPPSGEFTFKCKKCGRELLSIRPRKIGVVELPRYIELAAGSA